MTTGKVPVLREMHLITLTVPVITGDECAVCFKDIPETNRPLRQPCNINTLICDECKEEYCREQVQHLLVPEIEYAFHPQKQTFQAWLNSCANTTKSHNMNIHQASAL